MARISPDGAELRDTLPQEDISSRASTEAIASTSGSSSLVSFDDIVTWLICAALTSGVALAGASFGRSFVGNKDRSFAESLAHWDGQHYKHIIERGYNYDESHGSLVAFFPAYPLLGKALAAATGMPPVVALVAISNAGMLAAMVLFGMYLRARQPPNQGRTLLATDGPRMATREVCAMLSLALFPTSFFFRMAYTESLFLCVSILALYAVERRWPLLSISLLVGLSTAVRSVGVSLLLPLVWHVLRTSDSNGKAARRLAYALPVGCWGLAAFMLYQYVRFGQPLGFALTQTHWRMRAAEGDFDKFVGLLSWEPMWGPYLDGIDEANWLFGLSFGNPIYFVSAAALVAFGAWRRWLTRGEVLLAIPLLAIPYLTRAYEMQMHSQGRFAAVVFPAYIVLGYLLARVSVVVSTVVLVLFGTVMAGYAALFATAHPLI